MEYELICEGTCNRNRVLIDSMVSSAPRGTNNQALLSDNELAALRSLKHTTHRMVMDSRAQCVACGTVRRYGN